MRHLFFVVTVLMLLHSAGKSQKMYKLTNLDTIDFHKVKFIKSNYENGYNLVKTPPFNKYIVVPEYGEYGLEFKDLNDAVSYWSGNLNIELEVPEYMYEEREHINPATFVTNLPTYLERLKEKLSIKRPEFNFDLKSVKFVSETLFPIPDNDSELIFLLSVFADEVYRRETKSVWKFEKIVTLRPFYLPFVYNEKSIQRGVGVQKNSTDLLYQVESAISMTNSGEVKIPDFKKIIEHLNKKLDTL